METRGGDSIRGQFLQGMEVALFPSHEDTVLVYPRYGIYRKEKILRA